ncbi:hypothetical protein [Streptomyces canus]|uniref:hypothetical protein n=1 Tax=Streptomyces canus TaxID=58343 RepID=UPI00352E9E86
MTGLAKDGVWTRVGDYVYKINLTGWGVILLCLGASREMPWKIARTPFISISTPAKTTPPVAHAIPVGVGPRPGAGAGPGVCPRTAVWRVVTAS